AEDGIRDFHVTGVQTCALPISLQRLGADVLQRSLVKGLGRRMGVVLLGPADEGQVQALDAAGLGNGEVGAVGHPLIDEYGQRIEIGRASSRGSVSTSVMHGCRR